MQSLSKKLNNICGSMLVIGITKDGGRRLRRNVKKLLRLRKYVKTVDFLLYENNSDLQTKGILKNLQNSLQGFRYISEDLPPERLAQICTTKTRQGEPCRIELITYARNRLLQEVKLCAQNYEYILNIDLDVLLFDPLGALKSLRRFACTDFDCITGCGLTKWLRYRDAYAFRSAAFPFGAEFLGEYWWRDTWHKIQQRYPKGEKMPVFSAFGGAALYKAKAYIASTYDCHSSREFMEAHREVLAASAPSEDQLGFASAEPVPNTDYLAPIICEHVPFHYKMRKSGFGRIFVDTSWRFIFQD